MTASLRSSSLHWPAVGVMLGLLAAAGARPASAQGQLPTRQQFVGAEVCQGCHPVIAESFRRNPHYASVASGREPPERTGCEGCHGPGFQHAISADKARIVSFPALTPSQAQENCLACHAGDLGKMHVRTSAHAAGEVGCASCHAIHSPHGTGPLLAKRARELCYGCHQDIRARFEMPYKHRVNEGAMECTDCHNPHGAPVVAWAPAHSSRMLSPSFGNDQACVGCHADKRGPFVYEHPPVRVEGCTSCHNPHGSTAPRLLARPAAFTLCLECHNAIDGFGTTGRGVPGPTEGFHNLADPAFRECGLCHARIHGSNADPLFRR
ncbi:MAG: DmsE family decaheme c-type cytochrome [Bryobacterales bacterium]|nr:DmsE family decaheme c-type cytochrome [Bryobacterales bacterium]